MVTDGEEKAPPPPLSAVHVNRRLVAGNRAMAAVHAVLVATVIFHRVLALLSAGTAWSEVFLHAAMAVADATLLCLWALSQSGLWRPVTRAVFPDRLLARGGGELLPRVDVVVVTADPEKEPPVGVANTVVSAMALDYPGDKLAVYLSDDAGSPLTLLAAKKAYAFAAEAWVPFCRRHNVRCPWPDRYFAGDDGGEQRREEEVAEERARVKRLYERLKAEIEAATKEESISGSWTKEKRQDHDAYVEIISNNKHEDCDGDVEGEGEEEMPALVYVAREKRRECPHHFKAGALNALLRVSGVVSNAPYVLVLDCDMACNSRSSALEAMCFFLDHERRRRNNNGDLAFVQFPQTFHNLSRNDIYTNELRYIFGTRWFGLDGVRGPLLSGTGFYVRRDALYGATPYSTIDAGDDLLKAARFGHSDRLVASLRSSNVAPPAADELVPPLVQASYESGTAWGDGVGFMYQSVVEDYYTGFQRFFSQGWTSAYCHPQQPAFLGSVPTNLNDVLVQNKRWMSGMLAVGVSRRHSPLACRPLLRTSLLQAMAYAYFGLAALYAVPVLCYATLPQLCLLRGVPLFFVPSSGGAFATVGAAAFASSLLMHLAEVCVSRRGTLDLRTWWNEQRFWVLNALTGQLFGCVAAAQELFSVRALDFDLTSKADDGGRLYQEGVFDFTGCSTLLLPATTLSVLNAAAIVVGTCWKMNMSSSSAGDLLPQLLLMCYGATLSYPLLEGMFLRRDPARVPPRITALSVALAAVLLAVFAR